MRNIAATFTQVYAPQKALLIYKHLHNDDRYVESFDIDPISGKPINAHPLSMPEAKQLSQVLYSPKKEQTAFLQSNGVLPKNVLYINSTPGTGYAVWYTPPKKQKVYFKDTLGIPNGTADVPTLVWKAGIRSLTLFALPDRKRPTIRTRLYQAPFFNVYASGNVCMGSVDVKIAQSTSLEMLMQQWETYFFNSYFAHTISQSPTKSPVVSFWKSHVNSDKPFPIDELLTTPLLFSSLFK